MKHRVDFRVKFITMIDYSVRPPLPKRSYGYDYNSFPIENRIRDDVFGPIGVTYPSQGIMASVCHYAEALRTGS